MADRKRKREPQRPALQPLDDPSKAALNRSFYASDPGDHLNLRLQHLLRLAGQTDAELRREEQTYEFGGLSLTIPPISRDPADEDAHKRLVLIEAEMLLHQTAETLLRLFFAHAGKPDVPWIAISRLRGHGQFPREIKSRVLRPESSDRLKSDIGIAFFGSAVAHPDLAADVKAEREAVVSRVVGYLRYFAEVVISRDEIYNGAKHGLAVQAGEPSIRIADIDDLSVGGPAISFLTKRKSERGGREWVVETHWIDLEREFAFVYMGAWLIRAMWLSARIRYVGWPSPKDGLTMPGLGVEDVVSATRGGKGSGVVIESVAFAPVMHMPPGSGTDLLIQELED